MQDELTAKLRERAVREPPVGKAADSPRQSPVLRGRENTPQSRRHMTKSSSHNADAVNRPNGKVRQIANDSKLPSRNGASKAGVHNGHPPNGYRSGCFSREVTSSRADNREPETARNHAKTPDKYARKSTEGRESEPPDNKWVSVDESYLPR